MPGNGPNLTRQGTFNPEKGYKNVRFQQGAHVMDTDLNDAQDYASWYIQKHMAALYGPFPGRLRWHDFLPMPLNPNDADDVRNELNFHFTLGQLFTKLGTVDTEILRDTDGSLSNYIAYDYQKLVDDGSVYAAIDRPYANYLFRGSVTAAPTADSFTDAYKAFNANHRLTPTSASIDVNGGVAGAVPETPKAVDPTRFEFTEPACRVVWLTGANAGSVQNIQAVAGSTITLAAAPANPIVVGDEYVIIPGNAFADYKTDFDAALAANTGGMGRGLTNVGTLLFYAQVWEEDVSSEEDSDIVHPDLAGVMEPVHVTQLRWCVRVCRMKVSADDDAGFAAMRAIHQAFLLRLTNPYIDLLMDSVNGAQSGVAIKKTSNNGMRLSDVAPAFGGQNHLVGTRSTIHRLYDPAWQNSDWSGSQMTVLLNTYAIALSEATVDPAISSMVIAPLGHTWARQKENDADTLWPGWHPGRNSNDAGVSDFGVYESPAHPAGFFVPAAISFELGRLSTDLMLAPVIAGYGDPWSTLGANLEYPSLGSALTEMFYRTHRMTGLMNGMGVLRVGAGFSPPGVNFLETVDAAAMQAGQSAGVFVSSTGHMLNPSSKTQGALIPLDVLTGPSPSAGIEGPGQYIKRDGTVVTPDSDGGWSFYKNPTTIDDSTEPNLEIRKWDEGPWQAHAVQQSLMFRQLAIKTTAHAEKDLFNYRIGDPTTYDGGVGASESEWSLGAIYNHAGKQESTNPTLRKSHLGPPMATHGVPPNVQLYALERTSGAAAPATKVDTSIGPWGRFTKLATDVPDQFENQCTVLRVRYHIGDYYPGPDVDCGDDIGVKPTNALVQSLNLYLRVEPLSQVHWSTMPKHTHQSIADSMDFYSVLSELMNHLSWSPNVTGVVDLDDDVQPYIHWFHPNMEAILEPADGSGTTYTAYHKWGARSLISLGLVYQADQTEAGNPFTSAHDTAVNTWIDHYVKNLGGGTSATKVLGTHGSDNNGAVISQFPFLPALDTQTGNGRPGPVFLPAFATLADGTATEGDQFSIHPAFATIPAGTESYFPTADNGHPDGGPDITPVNAPFLRAQVTTPLASALLSMLQGDLSTGAQFVAPGPRWDTDLNFAGGMGLSVVTDATGGRESNLSSLLAPFVLGTNIDKVNYDGTNNYYDTYYDWFQALDADRQAQVDAAYLPLKASMFTKDLGLAQKLLWNCSFRVLHVRPGGGYSDSAGGVVQHSGRAKSLTELFLVRDRQTAQPIVWPKAPSGAADKPFIHLESMRPSASGLAPAVAHPNYPYIGHLYPMVSDSLGGKSDGNDQPNAYVAADYTNNYLTHGASGDTVMADPFDFEISKAANIGSQVRDSDRFFQNSGIEIDLLTELRYVRENAAAHGLNQANADGLTWLDMMPTPDELTMPGDHEIVLVLYTGKYGQKMIDGTVPDGFNAPFCGCHVTATLEVNRPSSKRDTEYGVTIPRYNVLGHL